MNIQPVELKDQLGSELQAAASNSIGNDISCKRVTPICVEGQTAERVYAINRVCGLAQFTTWFGIPSH